MRYTPAKPPLTGETLDSLTARLREKGEPSARRTRRAARADAATTLTTGGVR